MNSNGFGLKQMLIYSTIILLFVLIATFYVISLYSEINNDGIKKTELPEVKEEVDNSKEEKEIINYLDYEINLEDAVFRYLEDNGMIINSEIRLEYDILLDLNYVSKMADNCSGYVNIYPQDNVFSVKSYIKCDNYMTEGYE